jgi:hypothetical protein
VITLYNPGSEPDPSVYDVLRSLPRDHVPEIIETGRVEGRAYEVTEEFTAGTLADLGLLPDDMSTLSRVISELGGALNSFAERGLRHRDLRPTAILVRSLSPLDLVISSFGSARLSDFDLDIVAPLETTRYSAPEAIAGGVAAASDWWSLGIILLEQITKGRCFAGVSDQVFLIHVLTSGVSIPEDIEPRLSLLLHGLLARERRERWGWAQVSRWLAGETPPIPQPAQAANAAASTGPGLSLGGRNHTTGASFALVAATQAHWNEARDMFSRGAIVTWAEAVGIGPQCCAWLREIARTEGLSDDLRLGLALKQLNPAIPLICRGEIVTPGWLLDHLEEGHELITGPAPDLLQRMDAEQWLVRLKARATAVKQRAEELEIELNENDLRVHLLSTSRSRLAALWTERHAFLPDTEHPALLAILERRQTTEEDLILLLSAALGQFRTPRELLDDAAKQAAHAGFTAFDRDIATTRLQSSRTDLYAEVEARITGFVRCGIERIDEWVDQFRLERRLSLAHALVILAIPEPSWRAPPGQVFVATLLDFFAKRVSVAVQRGPLSRLTIGKTTPRIDLMELDTARVPAAAMLDRVLQRSDQLVDIDPAVLQTSPVLERRTRLLHNHATLYRRDTGIDGLYLGFPFVLMQEGGGPNLPRIAPVLLWPMRLRPIVGASGRISLGFDRDREEVRFNPALDGLLGPDIAQRWQAVAHELLQRSSLTAGELMDAFGTLLPFEGKVLTALPGKNVRIRPGAGRLVCSGVLFHLKYMGQAIVEDLRQLRGVPPASTALETCLRLASTPSHTRRDPVPELERFFTTDSDPSQEAAVFEARNAPGLVIEGPPGTGKSQTIVNMVADAVGRGRSVLVVCQKQPALDVVRRRLDAEGFGKRLVMITDVNADRERVVRSVREQIESIADSGPEIENVSRTRTRLAARLQGLKKDLDEHHAALHTVDPITGLSYRALLAELMALEREHPAPIDAPALRPLLGGLDSAALVAVEDECSAVAGHWLPARYENSALAVLQPFGTDRGVLGLFRSAFDDYFTAESQRDAVVARTPDAIRVADPNVSSEWLREHAPAFRRLATPERDQLARWMSLFLGADSAQANDPRSSEGEKLIAELLELRGSLENLPDPEIEPLRLVFSRLDARGLRLWLRLAERLNTPSRSFLAALSPLRWLDRQRFKSFFTKLALTPVGVPEFHRGIRHEADLRPLRSRFIVAAQRLAQAVAGMDSLSRRELLQLVTNLLRQLKNVRELMARARGSPHEAEVLDALRAATQDAIDTFSTAVLQGCERHGARARSHLALETLSSYVNQDWCKSRVDAIDDDRSNCESVASVANALTTLVPYQRYRGRALTLSKAALDVLSTLRRHEIILDRLAEGELEYVVRRTIAREARLASKARFESERPALTMERSEMEAKQVSLGETDKQLRKVNRQLLVDGIDVSQLRPVGEWEDITRLRGQRARRLREFISRGVDLGLMSLRPIWLMNPDIASRVLPLKAGLFDTIIFDEASQMPVEFALSTLYRGRVVVVSGDEKQMPPTSFFSSRVESDEDGAYDAEDIEEHVTEEEREALTQTWNRREIKDCPDLLQLAKSTLPPKTLQIHYRSSYRELIAFSNAAFYRNDLSIPICHPDEKVRSDRPIQLLRAEGVYENQTNPMEAESIVDVLKQLWSVPATQRKSTGVVTFSRKQADLIEDRLEARARKDPAFSDALTRERERVTDEGEDVRFFVKNVETVQGDERDIIVFSSTFGRNAQGTFRRNFGVLGQVGGERRLNVAVSRARERVVLVTSMPIAEISDLLTTHRPAASARDYLQAYFEYARATSAGEFDSSRALLSRLVGEQETRVERQRREVDGFMRSVIDFVRTLGFRAVARHDPGVFGVDLVVEDPRTGLYGLGIECDAPRHALLADARAREVWRPRLLTRTIARVHRISSRAWYSDRDAEEKRLQGAVQAALM